MTSLWRVENEAISREARRVGLRTPHDPTLRDIERRRMQVWSVSAVVLCGVSLILVISGSSQSAEPVFISQSALRIGMLLVVLAFPVYAFWKEVHLRRLSHLVIEHQVRNTALQSRIDELTALSAATRAANAVLEPRQVLDVILNGAIGVLGGTTGSIMLAAGDFLQTAAQSGNPRAEGAMVRIGDSVAGRVAKSRQPLIIDGEVRAEQFEGHASRTVHVASAISVPLAHRGELLGVLNINADGERRFRDYDLAVAGLFSDAASVAIANARLFDAERSHVADLLERDRRRQAFVASVSHEFNNPLTSLRGAVSLLRRAELNSGQEEVLGVLDRQVLRLGSLVDELKLGANTDRVATRTLQRLDVAALVRVIAADSEVAGRPIRVSGVRSALVMSDGESLRRVIDNLIDNAFKYGKPPVD